MDADFRKVEDRAGRLDPTQGVAGRQAHFVRPAEYGMNGCMTVPEDDADLRVEIENTATPEEAQAVQATLDEFQIPATATTTLEPEPRGGIEEIPLIVELAAGYSLIKFADAFLSEAGRDASQGVSNFMERLRSRRGRPGGYEVVMIDRQANVRVHLRDDLPAQAFSDLANFDFDALEAGELWFNRDTQEWDFYPDSDAFG